MPGSASRSSDPPPVVRARLVRRDALVDRTFDRDFWSEVGSEGRFAAAWEMVLDYHRMRGETRAEPGLQRTVCRLERR